MPPVPLSRRGRAHRAAADRRVASAAAALFGGLSRLRGRRIAHPFGAGFEATLMPMPGNRTGSALFDEAEALPAVVRLSRSIGLPEALADPCGLAFRVPDAYGSGRHQDFLLVSSGSSPLARHLLLPSRGFCARPYSSLLPYEIGGRTLLVGAEAAGERPGPRLADLCENGAARLVFHVTVATLRGPWERVAELRLGRPLAPSRTENLRLTPANAGGGITPVGFLNDLRPAAYAGSQDGRRAVEEAARAPAATPAAPEG